jgi:hypothetical protein
MNIFEKDKTYVAGTYGRFPLQLVRGKGCIAWDENGKEYIDLGSGMYGDMADALKNQFSNVPTYEEYAAVTAGIMADHFRGRHQPILFTEPGTTLINRYIDFVSKVISIKEIRGKTFVELNCSKHNLGEICELKKLPITVIPQGGEPRKIEDGELVGYTAESSFYKAFQSYYHMTPQEYRSAKVPVVTDK